MVSNKRGYKNLNKPLDCFPRCKEALEIIRKYGPITVRELGIKMYQPKSERRLKTTGHMAYDIISILRKLGYPIVTDRRQRPPTYSIGLFSLEEAAKWKDRTGGRPQKAVTQVSFRCDSSLTV